MGENLTSAEDRDFECVQKAFLEEFDTGDVDG